MPGHGAGPADGRNGARAKLKSAGFFTGHEARGGVRKTCQVFRAHGNGNSKPGDYVVPWGSEAGLLPGTRGRRETQAEKARSALKRKAHPKARRVRVSPTAGEGAGVLANFSNCRRAGRNRRRGRACA
jgi:hypothetical protein